MKSIKEYNTSGMLLSEREELFKKVIPIPIGTIVFRAGDFASYTEPVLVNKNNQKEITMFWNALYFDEKSKADLKTCKAHSDYNDYQSEMVNMMKTY